MVVQIVFSPRSELSRAQAWGRFPVFAHQVMGGVFRQEAGRIYLGQLVQIAVTIIVCRKLRPALYE